MRWKEVRLLGQGRLAAQPAAVPKLFCWEQQKLLASPGIRGSSGWLFSKRGSWVVRSETRKAYQVDRGPKRVGRKDTGGCQE